MNSSGRSPYTRIWPDPSGSSVATMHSSLTAASPPGDSLALGAASRLTMAAASLRVVSVGLERDEFD